jgi:hypothetical protein
LAKWLSRQIRDELDKETDCMFRDSVHVTKRLRGTPVPPGSKLAKVDLSDFYLSGTADELVVDVMRLFPSRHFLNPLRHNILTLLLYFQFVKGRAAPGIFRVAKGSGMGLIHSGDVADAAYWIRVERWIRSPRHPFYHHVHAYGRFKDDSIFVFDDFTAFRTVVDEMRSRGSYFTIKVEQVSKHTMLYLQVQVSLANNMIRCQYGHKQAAIPQPLSALSGQSAATHRSWPTTMIRTIAKISESEDDAVRAASDLKTRLDEARVPLLWPDHSKVRELCRRTRQVNAPGTEYRTLWLPFTRDPRTSRLLSCALRSFLEANALLTARALGETHLRTQYNTVRFAWKNAAPALEHTLRRMPRTTGDG